MPEDKRIFAAILILGAAVVVTRLIEVGSHVAALVRWHLDAEAIVVDAQTNGGVRSTA